jgi:hypothetical protein
MSTSCPEGQCAPRSQLHGGYRHETCRHPHMAEACKRSGAFWFIPLSAGTRGGVLVSCAGDGKESPIGKMSGGISRISLFKGLARGGQRILLNISEIARPF